MSTYIPISTYKYISMQWVTQFQVNRQETKIATNSKNIGQG